MRQNNLSDCRDSVGMLEKQRLDGCYQHTAEPDQTTCVEVIMASAVHATILSCTKECEQCGSIIRRGEYDVASRWASRRFCGTSCKNRASADHSPETLMVRFWAKVDKTPGNGPNGDCWHWKARVDGRGYGEIKVAGKYKKAHRLSLFGYHDLDNPLFACHRCDNPRCVRPDHLYPGEAIDNVSDMVGRGRHGRSGVANGKRKLTSEQANEIRASPYSIRRLAKDYSVSRMTISGIKEGRIYVV